MNHAERLVCAPGWLSHRWDVTPAQIGPPLLASLLYYTCTRCGQLAYYHLEAPYP